MMADRSLEGAQQQQGKDRDERPSGVQQQLVESLGKAAFRALAILTSIMPHSERGREMRQHALGVLGECLGVRCSPRHVAAPLHRLNVRWLTDPTPP